MKRNKTHKRPGSVDAATAGDFLFCHRKKVLYGIILAVIFYIANQLSWLYGYCTGSGAERFMVLLEHLDVAFSGRLPSMDIKDIAVGVVAAAIAGMVLYLREIDAKKYRHGSEFGSARWGTAKDIRPYINPIFRDNIILTKTERLTMEARPKNPKYARNKNCLILGGSGSGKTRYYLKPNLMQMGDNVSYIVTDPKGQVLVECGRMLYNGGYDIRVFNTVNFSKSMKYNPFVYIHSEKDILKLVTVIMENTNAEGSGSSDPFWPAAEKLLFSALIGYIWYEAPEEEKNFSTLLDFVNASEVHEDDEAFKNGVDLLFEDLEAEAPDHFAVRQYKRFKLAAGKTAKSILISCGSRLSPFDIKELRDVMDADEMDFDTIGTRRTALFIIVSDTDTTFNFVAAMMYAQLFNRLCDLADDKYGGRLPYHVRILADEMANIGKIPNFDKLIATIRSREISVSIILQAKSQLKTMYKEAAETIMANCDSLLFLGGKEESTLKEMSELLGKETIDYYNISDTRGKDRSYGTSYQKTGKALMTKDELAVMDGGKCILQLRGVRPFLSDKYDITRHPRYKELSDYDKRNAFNVKSYIHPRCKVKNADVFECYEVG